MNFKINELELVIDDALVEKAEQLCAEKRVHGLVEMDKNLWVAQIDDNQGYEVEVKLINQRVKNATCDCIFFNKDTYCRHLAAVLLQLRTFFKARDKQKIKKETKVFSKVLRTSTLLKYVEEAALHDFVRSYARKNTDFDIALKLHFAAVVPFESNIGKYTQVLEKILSPKKQGLKNLVQFKVAVKKLLDQAAELMLNKNISESTIIYKAILTHITLFLKNSRQKDFIEITESIFVELAKIQPADLAPNVKDDLFQFYIEKSSHPVMLKTGYAFNYIDLAAQLAIDRIDKNRIEEVIDAILQQDDITEELLVQLILIKLTVVENQQKTLEAIVVQYADKPQVMQIVVSILMENGHTTAAKELILICNSRLMVNTYFDEKLLEIAILENDKKQIVHFAAKRLIETLALSYYYILAKAAGKRRNKTITNLLKNIQKLPFSVEKRDLYAAILNEEFKMDALIEYIDQLGSFDLLLKYDNILITNGYKERVAIIYKRLISDYLKNHIGEKAALKIKNVLMHLMAKDSYDFSDELVNYIRVTYPKRATLMQTLQELVLDV